MHKSFYYEYVNGSDIDTGTWFQCCNITLIIRLSDNASVYQELKEASNGKNTGKNTGK